MILIDSDSIENIRWKMWAAKHLDTERKVGEIIVPKCLIFGRIISTRTTYHAHCVPPNVSIRFRDLYHIVRLAIELVIVDDHLIQNGVSSYHSSAEF